MGSSFVPRSIGAAALAILTSIGACAELLGGDGYHIRGEDAGADRAVASSAGGMPVAPPPPEGGPDVGAESPSFIDMDAPVVPSCMTAGDCPPPVEACRIAACEAHRCSTNLAPAGSDCGGNARCTTEGECVFCRLDGVANDSETDIDCGGPYCPPCRALYGCRQANDCETQHCDNIVAGVGVCYPATCSDSLHNGDEGDVDCGGICPDKCGQGKQCTVDEDCATSFCVDDVCCGVPCDGPCKSCLPGTGACELSAAGTDPGGLCPGAANNCNEDGLCEYCADSTPNGDETGVDCGGQTCPPCPAGGDCLIDEDCASCVCVSGACEAPHCDDGLRDGCETDVDCGGPCGPTCAIGQACRIKADCALFNCVEGQCVE